MSASTAAPIAPRTPIVLQVADFVPLPTEESRGYLFAIARFAVIKPALGALAWGAATAAGAAALGTGVLDHPNPYIKALGHIAVAAGLVLPWVELSVAMVRNLSDRLRSLGGDRSYAEIRAHTLQTLTSSTQGVYGALRERPALAGALSGIALWLQTEFLVHGSALGKGLAALILNPAYHGVTTALYVAGTLLMLPLLRATYEGFHDMKLRGHSIPLASWLIERAASALPFIFKGGCPPSLPVAFYRAARKSVGLLGTPLQLGFIYFLAASALPISPAHAWIVDQVANTPWGGIAWTLVLLAGVRITRGIAFLRSQARAPKQELARGDFFHWDLYSVWERFEQLGKEMGIAAGAMAVGGYFTLEALAKQVFSLRGGGLLGTLTDSWASLCHWIPEQGIEGTPTFVPSSGDFTGLLNLFNIVVILLAVKTLSGARQSLLEGRAAKAAYEKRNEA